LFSGGARGRRPEEIDMSRLAEIARRAGEVPPLPHVALKVIQLAGQSTTSAADLENVISHDPVLVGSVLKQANSAYYGVRGGVATIGHAVLVLGFGTLRTLVITACSRSLLSNKKSSFKDRILWEHSIAAAIVSKLVAREVGYESPEEAFVAGLLHDIGKVVLDTNHPAAFQQVIERVYNDGESFVDAEREAFGLDHGEVGGLVVGKWGLAEELVEAVRHHHEPESATLDPRLCATVGLANAICVKLEIGPEKRPDLEMAAVPAQRILRLDAAAFPGLLERAQRQVADDRQLLAFD
jgi:putative nucleotidyltransferase with HDIG domain